MAFASSWNTPLNEGDRAFAHELFEEASDEETEELLEVAVDAQAMAHLRYDDYRCSRDRDDYAHALTARQERCAKAYARSRALHDMWLAEVAS